MHDILFQLFGGNEECIKRFTHDLAESVIEQILNRGFYPYQQKVTNSFCDQFVNVQQVHPIDHFFLDRTELAHY